MLGSFFGKSTIYEEGYSVPIYLMLIPLILAIALLIFTYIKREKIKDNKSLIRKIDLGIIVSLIVLQLSSWIWTALVLKDFQWEYLPLQLCSLTLITAIVFMITKKKILHQLTFYFAIFGAFVAFVISDLNYGALHFQYYRFTISHALIIIAYIYFMIIHESHISTKRAIQSLGVLIILSLVMLVLNVFLDTFFFYIGPTALEKISILQKFGKWPTYLIPFFFFVSLLYTIPISISYILEKKGKISNESI